MTEIDGMKRVEALASHLGIDIEEIEETDYDEKVFEAEGNEYLVVTDSEADEIAAQYIKDSLWAFNAEFLEEKIPLDAKTIRVIQENMSEDANEVFVKLLGDYLPVFTQQAISADGRGHFMSSYDGHEWQDGEFYIYRIN